MAFDFPSSPVIDQVYTSADGIMYAWDGVAWMKGSGSGTGGVPPTGPVIPPVGADGQALVASSGAAVWGAPINGGGF